MFDNGIVSRKGEKSMGKESVRIIRLRKTILDNNDKDADDLRKENSAKNLFYINLMSSPGSGKTSILLSTIRALQKDLRIGVMEADIDSDVDAAKILRETGVPSVQLHTGGMCHLDAQMSRQGLAFFAKDEPEAVFLENVGNLVCPAEFDTGADLNVVILSIPEGDDKPLKYPLMFQEADVILLNKMDVLPVFDFDIEQFTANVRKRNSKAPLFLLSAKTGEGMNDWIHFIRTTITSHAGSVQ